MHHFSQKTDCSIADLSQLNSALFVLSIDRSECLKLCLILGLGLLIFNKY